MDRGRVQFGSRFKEVLTIVYRFVSETKARVWIRVARTFSRSVR